MTTVYCDGGSEFICTTCKKGRLRCRDHVKRICRLEGGETEWFIIPRHQCDNDGCGRMHRMVPDFLVPFKHYKAEIISGVLDGIVTPSDEDSFDQPSENTMKAWNHWLMSNLLNIEGILHSEACRNLGFSESFMKSGEPLLPQLRLMYQDWLEKLFRFIYNTGNRLVPVY